MTQTGSIVPFYACRMVEPMKCFWRLPGVHLATLKGLGKLLKQNVGEPMVFSNLSIVVSNGLVL